MNCKNITRLIIFFPYNIIVWHKDWFLMTNKKHLKINTWPFCLINKLYHLLMNIWYLKLFKVYLIKCPTCWNPGRCRIIPRYWSYVDQQLNFAICPYTDTHKHTQKHTCTHVYMRVYTRIHMRVCKTHKRIHKRRLNFTIFWLQS